MAANLSFFVSFASPTRHPCFEAWTCGVHGERIVTWQVLKAGFQADIEHAVAFKEEDRRRGRASKCLAAHAV